MADSQEFRKKFFLGNFVFLGILVAILVALFLLRDALSGGKIDLTQDQVYTTSPSTKEILSKLIDDVLVTYYVSEDLPSMLQNLRRDTQDLFSEFHDLSNKHFQYSIVNPEEKAAEFAETKVAEYFAAKKDGKPLQEPEPPQSIDQIFGGRKPPTAEEIRESRDKAAGQMAEAQGRNKDDVYRDLLRRDWHQNFLQKLEQEGIEPFPVMERNASSVRQVKVYSAIEVKYLDKQPEIHPVHWQLENLEYELASRILKLTTDEKPLVAFFDGRKPPMPPMNPMNPMQPPPSDYEAVINHFQQFFDVRSIDLKEGDSIDDLVLRLKEDRKRKAEKDSGEEKKDEAKEEDKTVTSDDVRLIRCLVVAQPDNLEPRQVYEINRAVSLGVPTILLTSRFSLDVSQRGLKTGLPIAFLNSGLEDFLKKLGIELGPDILASNLGGEVALPTNVGGGLQVLMPRPLAASLQVEKDSIDQTAAITREINALTFPATCGLKVLKEAADQAGLKIEVLARTNKQTWATKINPFERLQNPLMKHQGMGASVVQYQKDLVGMKNPDEFKDFVEPMPLAVLVHGKIPFALQGENVPEWKKEAKNEDDPHTGIPGFPSKAGSFGLGDGDLLLNPLDPQDAKDASPAGSAPAPAAGPAPTPEEAKAPELKVAPALPGDAAPAPAAAGPVPRPDLGPPSPPLPAQPAPEGAAMETKAGAAPVEPPKPPQKANVEPAESGRLLVLASVDMLRNDFVQQGQDYRGNVLFLQNAIENFGLGDLLINIRRKQLTARQFKPDSDKVQTFITVLNIAVVPALVGALGLAYYLRRRSESVRYERKFIQR